MNSQPSFSSSGQMTSEFPGFSPTPGRSTYYNAERKIWVVSRYTEVVRVFSDYKTFSSNRGGLDPKDVRKSTAMIELDPPRHQQLRTLISQAFTPRVIAKLEPQITRLVHTLIDAVIDQGKMDIIDDFSGLLPLGVICEMLGVPSEDRAKMRHWTDIAVEAVTPAVLQAANEMKDYFIALIQERRERPQEDLLSALLAAQVDGQHLTTEELLQFCGLLIIAGNETTKNLIGNVFLCFERYRDTIKQLRATPDLLPGAIEEVLRYLPPVVVFPRVAAIDTIIEGQEIKAGEWVVGSIMSANRDEEQFIHPEVFDIKRTPNRHIAFSHGIHYCLGAALARLEVKIAVQALLERFSAINFVESIDNLIPITSPVDYGVKHLPITFKRT